MGGASKIEIHFKELADGECPACGCGLEVREKKKSDAVDFKRAFGEIYALAAMSAMTQTFALKDNVHLWVATFCEPHRAVMRALGAQIANGCAAESAMAHAIVETMDCTKLIIFDDEGGRAHGTH